MSCGVPVTRTGFIAALLAVLLCALGAEAAHAAVGTLAGNDNVGPSIDSNEAGTPEAFKMTATASGTARSLNAFLDDGSEAAAVELGLYDDADGHPGRLLARGMIAAPRNGSWNTANIPATAVDAGTTYWIAILGLGGTVRFRDHCCGGGTPAETNVDVSVDRLPTAWSSGSTWQDGPASVFASTDEAPSGDPPDDTDGAITISVNPSDGIRTIDGIGVNANVHSWHDGELKPAIDHLVSAGISTWRVIIDRCDWEQTNDDEDPSQMNWDYYNRVYSQGKMADLWATIAYIESHPGQQVSLSCMGGAPQWMGGTATFSVIDLDKEDEFVEQLASMLYYGRNVKHLDIKLFSPANETNHDGNEGPKIDEYQYVRLLHKLAVRLDQLNLSDIRFVGPDTAGATSARLAFVPELGKDALVASKLAHVAVHSYSGDVDGIGAAVKDAGFNSDFWVTEFSAWCEGCDSGLPNPSDWNFAAATAEQIFSLLDQGASGMQIYDGWDGHYEHHGATGYWGTEAYDALTGTYSPRKTFYVMEHFAKFVPRGSQLTDARSSSRDVAIKSFRDPVSGRLTVVLQNHTYEDQRVSGSIESGPEISSFESYISDEASNFVRGADLAIEGGSFSVDLPRRALVTLTGVPADSVAPSVSFDVPAAGSTVSRTVDVDVSATDDTGVVRVEFAVDGEPMGVDDSAPFGFDWDTTTLTDGNHTITAVAYDAAGNISAPAAVTVNVANTGTVIDDGPSAVTNSTSARFTFSAGETGSTFECRLDGPDEVRSYVACTSPQSYADLPDGQYRFLVRATDPAGNTDLTPAVRTFRVDTAAPAAAVVTAPTDGSVQQSGVVEFVGTAEADATVFVAEASVDRGQAHVDAGGQWSLALSALAEGTHTFDVRVRDIAGNESATTTVRMTVDFTAPETVLVAGGEGLAFAFSSPDADATFECRLDGPGATTGTFGPCTSPKSYPGLAEGDYAFLVRAVDRAGNVDATPATRSFNVDTRAPETTITGGPAELTKEDSPSFTFTADESGSNFQCRLDGPGTATGSYAACSSPKAYSALADGLYTLFVRAIDPAGNTDQTSATRTFTIDTQAPPAPTVTSPQDGSVQASRTVQLVGTAESSTTILIDEGADRRGSTTTGTDGGWSFDVTDAEAGRHSFSVRARDAAGNASMPTTVQVTVDLSVPETTIDSGPNGPTKDSSPSFTFSSSKPGSTFECRLDGPGVTVGGFEACASPKAFSALADGDYTLRVRAIDAAGNSDESPDARSFKVDSRAPQTTILGGPTGATSARSVSFGLSADEPGASFECRLDGPGAATGAYEACVSPKLLDDLADGEYTLRARATDAAGNTDQSSATRTFTVDTSAPETTITGGPTGPTNVASPSFGLSSTEADSAFECRIDGPGWAGTYDVCTSPMTYPQLADGGYTLRVRATDTAGNVDTTPATRAFTVDTLAPETTIDSGPSGSITARKGVFAFSSSDPSARIECQLQGPDSAATFGSCVSPATYEFNQLGGYTFAVTAVDQAGNADPTPAKREFNVSDAVVENLGPGRSETPTPTPSPTVAPATKPTPTLGRDAVITPKSGVVLLRRTGAKTAARLSAPQVAPSGSTLDTKRGSVQIEVATSTGKTYAATVQGGVFKFTQNKGGVLELVLTDPLDHCSGRPSRRQKTVPQRQLRVDTTGRVRVTSLHASTAAKSGKWLVQDSCAGTLVRVFRGRVSARQGNRASSVKAGKKLLIPSKR